MVKYIIPLDSIFGSLADPTRRDILSRLLLGDLNVGEVASSYDMSLAAISKHLRVLEDARLIRKRRQGKERVVSLVPETMMCANEYLNQYERSWNERLDRLTIIVEENHE